MTAAARRVAVLAAGLAALGLAACKPPLSGTYRDVEDPDRFYRFSEWTRSWESYYDESGAYRVDGQRLILEVSGGLEGEIVSPDEFRLDDVPGFNQARPYNVYRRERE